MFNQRKKKQIAINGNLMLICITYWHPIIPYNKKFIARPQKPIRRPPTNFHRCIMNLFHSLSYLFIAIITNKKIKLKEIYNKNRKMQMKHSFYWHIFFTLSNYRIKKQYISKRTMYTHTVELNHKWTEATKFKLNSTWVVIVIGCPQIHVRKWIFFGHKIFDIE